MKAKDIYQMRNAAGVGGVLGRALSFAYLRLRPPFVPSRGQAEKVLREHVQAGARVLMIGSNLPPTGLRAFSACDVVQLDIKRLEHVDVVGDAERLTEVLEAESFDYVICTNMLEHTRHPWSVVAEAGKALRSGGILYISVPWIFPFHGEPYDYWRFSVPCLKTLVKEAGLDEIASGSEMSGYGALAHFLKTHFAESFSFGNELLFYSLEYVFSWALFPVGWLELAPRPKRFNYYCDSIVYIVAKKPAEVRPDA